MRNVHQRPSRRRRARRALQLERLEDRTLLANAHVFAQFEGFITTPGQSRQIDLSVNPDDFTLDGDRVILGFQVRPRPGSTFDPAAVQVRDADNNLVPLRLVDPDVLSRPQSLVLADLPAGIYRLSVAGERGTTGTFQLDCFLAGDVNGDRQADDADGATIAGIFGVTADDSRYLVEADANLDGIITSFDYTQWRDNRNDATRLNPAPVPAVTEVSPANGEELVSPARETIVRFSERIDPATINADTFYLVANGVRVPGRIQVSATEQFVTFFPTNPLPASTQVRVVVEGDRITGRNGRGLDANNDAEPGGQNTADFRTLPLTRIPGTNVVGFVFDSFNRLPGGGNRPIVGATIRVDAFPQANVVTDANGRFELRDMPAPEFFVHIDGTTATNPPAGFGYPSVGKALHSVPGQTVQLNAGPTGSTFSCRRWPRATSGRCPRPRPRRWASAPRAWRSCSSSSRPLTRPYGTSYKSCFHRARRWTTPAGWRRAGK